MGAECMKDSLSCFGWACERNALAVQPTQAPTPPNSVLCDLLTFKLAQEPCLLQTLCAPHSSHFGPIRNFSGGLPQPLLSCPYTSATQHAWPPLCPLISPYPQNLAEMPPTLIFLLEINPFSSWNPHHVIHVLPEASSRLS